MFPPLDQSGFLPHNSSVYLDNSNHFSTMKNNYQTQQALRDPGSGLVSAQQKKRRRSDSKCSVCERSASRSNISRSASKNSIHSTGKTGRLIVAKCLSSSRNNHRKLHSSSKNRYNNLNIVASAEKSSKPRFENEHQTATFKGNRKQTDSYLKNRKRSLEYSNASIRSGSG